MATGTKGTKVRLTAATKPLLQDQVKAQSAAGNLKGVHENRRSLDERAFYPAHDLRKESPAYKKVHDHLVKDLNLPCLICGVTNKILKDPKKRKDSKYNPYGAKQMETHHHVIEWALANAVDPEKFNQRVLPHLKVRHPESYKNKLPFTAKEVIDWVDHSPENLWVLCDMHHRHKWVGIHMISDPIWGPQDILFDDFAEAVNKALRKDGACSRKKKK
jgi:hypothetical protein